MSASRASKSKTTPNARRKSPVFDGRLNLEQQRKRAKELLKALYHQDPTAQQRLAAYFQTKTADDACLADAQYVIARENGFASWPKLKSHIDRITEHNRQIASGHIPTLDDQTTLHLRCGSDIAHALKLAGFVGDFLEFADPFCQGPVPDLPLPQFIETRARFIADAYDLEFKDALARLHREYAALTRIGDYDHVVLWFEHDSYDQLILAFLLDFLAILRPKTRLELIAVDHVPGVKRFIGLGQLSPELLIWCWENARQPITDDMLLAGQECWAAIRAPAPDALNAIIHRDISAIPCMIPALKRHLAELPDPQTGLGLTQKLTLQILANHGPLSAGKIFAHLMQTDDPLPYLGDMMFWHVLNDMGNATTPLFDITPPPAHTPQPTSKPIPWPDRMLSLTTTGQNILNGSLSFLDVYTGKRWVGGIGITGKGSH